MRYSVNLAKGITVALRVIILAAVVYLTAQTPGNIPPRTDKIDGYEVHWSVTPIPAAPVTNTEDQSAYWRFAASIPGSGLSVVINYSGSACAPHDVTGALLALELHGNTLAFQQPVKIACAFIDQNQMPPTGNTIAYRGDDVDGLRIVWQVDLTGRSFLFTGRIANDAQSDVFVHYNGLCYPRTPQEALAVIRGHHGERMPYWAGTVSCQE